MEPAAPSSTECIAALLTRLINSGPFGAGALSMRSPRDTRSSRFTTLRLSDG
jgi:hypothetical protein